MEIIKFKVTTDLADSVNFLGKLTNKLQSPEPLMNSIAEIIAKDIEDCFENERDPNGSPWAELAPSTIAARQRKKQTPIRKLRASEKGIESIRVVPFRDTVRVMYGAGKEEYMKYHRTGTDRMPKRDFIPSEADIERSTKIRQAVTDYFNPSLRQFARREIVRTSKLFQA